MSRNTHRYLDDRKADCLELLQQVKFCNKAKGVLDMFAPIVVLVRDWMGKPKFNQIRGKAIALHCQTITNFCNRLGFDSTQRQSLIRLAKDNGKKLGLLA